MKGSIEDMVCIDFKFPLQMILRREEASFSCFESSRTSVCFDQIHQIISSQLLAVILFSPPDDWKRYANVLFLIVLLTKHSLTITLDFNWLTHAKNMEYYMVVVFISANGFILLLKLNLSNCGPTVPVAQKSSILCTAPWVPIWIPLTWKS